MINLPFCRRRLFFDKIAGALVLALLCAASASAEVLVSEGCDMASDYAGAAAISANGTNLLKTYPKTLNASTGIADGAKWTGWGDKPKAYAATLPLPASFADAGLTSRGGACVGLARGTANTQHRWGYLKLAADKLKRASGSTFYFRGLMNVDSKAAAALTTTSDAIASGNSFGFGLSTRLPSATTGDNGNPLFATNALGFYYWRDTSGKYNLSGLLTDSTGASVTVPVLSGLAAPSEENVTSGNTFICYAEVKVDVCVDGREVVRVGAVRVSDYNRAAVVWSDPVAVELVSDDDYPTDLFFTGDYCTTGCAMFDEFVAATALSEALDVAVVEGMPIMSGDSIDRTESGFLASAVLSNASADDCGVIAFDGVSFTKLSAGPLAAGGRIEKAFTIEDIPDGKTYSIYLYAEHGVLAATNFVDVVYVGTPTIVKESDADEYRFSPGSVVVSRQDSSFDLKVNLVASGSAVPDVNYQSIPGCVIIPSGAQSVTVDVRPLFAEPHNADTTLTVTLAQGSYVLGETPGAVSVIISNLVPPVGTNTWVAATDGSASVSANWSLGRVPVATDDILIDSTFSTANLTWDGATEGMPATVKSWTQLANYTGRVTIPTTRTGAFTCFTVTGNVELNGGEWWRSSGSEDVWLNVAVGGNLTVGNDFTFNGKVAGRPKNNGDSPGADKGSGRGASHGGLGANGALPGGGKTYGDYRNPTSLGSGDYGSQAGGGAISLDVTGDFVLDGKVTADAGSSASYGGASGGSVWIRANRMSGTGSVTAKGAGSTNNNRYGGGGGRISIQLKSADFGHAEFKSAFTGTISAAGGYTTSNTNTRYSPGAAGTVYVETVADDGKGRMILSNKTNQDLSKYNAHTAVAAVWTNVTWNISTLELKDNGRVGIKKDAEIHMPKFAAISGDGTDYALLFFDGGTLSSDIKHDRLVANGFAVEGAGTNSFAKHTLVIPDDSSLKVSGDFTVGALIMGRTRLAKGDYSADTLKTYDNIYISDDGTMIHVLGLADALKIIVR